MINIKNLKNSKPIDIFDIKVDRTSPLGNPFYMSNESKRNDVCDKYRTYIIDKIRKQDKLILDELYRIQSIYKQYGKLNLYCWCAPKRCHAETIKELLLPYIKKN